MAVVGKYRSLWFGLLIDNRKLVSSTNWRPFSMQVNRKGGAKLFFASVSKLVITYIYIYIYINSILNSLMHFRLKIFSMHYLQ